MGADPFLPSRARRRAIVSDPAEYERLYRWSIDSPESFWSDVATTELEWSRPWSRVLEGNVPQVTWFRGGELNASVNCLDRHLDTRGGQVALLWESEAGQVRQISYAELHEEVCRIAGALAGLGIDIGDRVAICMPMIPEAVIAMLACARLGAPHVVMFDGFSAEALRERIHGSGAKVCITADGGYRRGRVVSLKPKIDIALQGAPTVRSCVVVRRTGETVPFVRGRDVWWHDVLRTAASCSRPAAVAAESPLFIHWTSDGGSRPKGVVHSTAGFLLGVHLTTKYLFDLRSDDVYWCTANIGWMTGHGYVVYGPLSIGATVVLYEGAPDYPTDARLWSVIERWCVSVFYTAPTAIRACMSSGADLPGKHDLSSLRLLGKFGEVMSAEAWQWYHDVVGYGRCPIVDTWWQAESGAIMIAQWPGITPISSLRGGWARPFLGVDIDVVRRDGGRCATEETGLLVVKRPWPSMLRGLVEAPESERSAHDDLPGDNRDDLAGDRRIVRDYWSEIPGCFSTGEGAHRDADGFIRVTGRIDDVLLVCSHRLSPAEIERALMGHPAVSEAAVVGPPHKVKGQAIFAFVTLQSEHEAAPDLKTRLADFVAAAIGTLARPDDIQVVDAIPKTAAGRIQRRLLKEVATNLVALARDDRDRADVSKLVRNVNTQSTREA